MFKCSSKLLYIHDPQTIKLKYSTIILFIKSYTQLYNWELYYLTGKPQMLSVTQYYANAQLEHN